MPSKILGMQNAHRYPPCAHCNCQVTCFLHCNGSIIWRPLTNSQNMTQESNTQLIKMKHTTPKQPPARATEKNREISWNQNPNPLLPGKASFLARLVAREDPSATPSGPRLGSATRSRWEFLLPWLPWQQRLEPRGRCLWALSRLEPHWSLFFKSI